jgi:hypothetical protein
MLIRQAACMFGCTKCTMVGCILLYASMHWAVGRCGGWAVGRCVVWEVGRCVGWAPMIVLFREDDW